MCKILRFLLIIKLIATEENQIKTVKRNIFRAFRLRATHDKNQSAPPAKSSLREFYRESGLHRATSMLSHLRRLTVHFDILQISQTNPIRIEVL